MSHCVEKLPHSCGSSDGLQVFENDKGKFDGFCFACGKYEPDPYADKPAGYKPTFLKKTQAQIDAEIAEISTYKTVDLPDRKLKKEYLEYFGVKIGLSEQDGQTPITHYYPYFNGKDLIAYKARIIEGKRMWGIGSTKTADLFGWQQAITTGAKRLFITEGECDAVALFQIIKDHNRGTKYAEFNPAVVSLSNGSGGAVRDLTKALKAIRETFKEICLVFDNDEAGRKAKDDVVRLIPDAIVAVLPAKDANDCLIEGRSKACHDACVFNAKVPKNTRIVAAESLHEAARKMPELGFSWPWKHVTEKTRGIRLGETIYIGAGQKQG